jgi:hypothetical protein
MNSENIVKWLEGWYLSQCNGDWEHSSGITIETLDNPGWNVQVNFVGTTLEVDEYDSGLIQRTEDDWYHIKTKDGIFDAVGDPSKLEFLLTQLKDLVSGKKLTL